MDPYVDTVPYDRGEEIKKHVRERDGADREGRPNDEQNIEDPPRPESELNNYNRERLQKGLRYIDEAAKRKITPRTQVFLTLHKDAYKVALEAQAPKEASQAVVQVMDEVYCSAAFYFKPRSSEEYEHLMLYVKLRRLEFLANYGDYLGQELQEIRLDLKAIAIGASSEVRVAAIELGPPRSCLDTASELAGDVVGNLRKDVDIACGVLGIDSIHMSWLIKEWADRNRIHNPIRRYISDCRWVSLAQQICRDLKEILNVAPDQETAAKYEKILLTIQDEYFDVLNRDDHEHWLPNEKMMKLIQDKVAREKKRSLMPSH